MAKRSFSFCYSFLRDVRVIDHDLPNSQTVDIRHYQLVVVDELHYYSGLLGR